MAAPPSLAFAGTEPEDLAVEHDVDVSPLTGAATVRIPLALTPGRSEFGPQLVLEYDSSSGNSPYGLGWSLNGLLTIAINTRKGLPKYDGKETFIFSGDGELVPVLRLQDGQWQPWIDNRGDFWVHCFRGRVENTHIRIEQWVHKITRRMHWRTRDIQNVVTVYGLDSSGQSRMADPSDPSRTFAWLPEAQFDPDGNAIQFDYAAENRDGVDPSLSYERSRASGVGSPQRYLKRIRYGNTRPLQPGVAIPGDNHWLFEVVLDYGDHANATFPTTVPDRPWALRPDPYSTYSPGFEVRTYRLCRRVLLFHRFSELGHEPVLVGMHRLEHDLHPEGTTLKSVEYTGFRRDPISGEISQKSLPPLRFTYSTPSVARSFQPAPEGTSQNVPHGLSDGDYRWIDLYGEGLPGILAETGDAWYFKPNEGGGHFGPQQLVIDRPAYRLGQVALSDFDDDGDTKLAIFHGRQGGFYEFDRDAGAWHTFRPFESLPHLEAAGGRAQWLDLDGDGRVDLMFSDPDRFCWYPCLGREGFGPAVEIQRPHPAGLSVAPLAEDLSLDFYFADMNGDGLVDQVHARNGRVEYWPHLGNGVFGDPILMENSPIFAPDDEFEASRLFLVDLDGNGAADLLYVGRGEVRYWINAQGNRLVEGGRIDDLPYIDNISTLRVLDFLGDGTPCLVWSSPLAGHPTPIQYLALTSGIKPRLLLSVDNSMGREVRLSFSTSATHYLRDKKAGRPWHAKLPRHPIVVDEKETIDQIGGSRSVTRYEYHDGYFDGAEQAFRGFGLVDQYDTELHGAGTATPEVAYTAPACLRTWFHPGRAALGALAEGYRADVQQYPLPPHSFENLAEFGAGDYEDALRALSGLVVRQELFAITLDGLRADHPFQVVQNSYRLRRLQPARHGLDACFTFYPSERLVYDYEQQPDDPRITHDFTLDVDTYGNALEECSVSYARRPAIPATMAAQQRVIIGVRTHRYANVEELDRHEVGIPIEDREFEAHGLTPGPSGIFERDQLRQSLAPTLAAPLAYHEDFTGGVQARLIGWDRVLYWDDALNAPLPLGSVGVRTLPHHQESACFTPGFVSQVFDKRVDAKLLQADGGYQQQDGYWWRSGDTFHFQPASAFYRLARIERPDGGITLFSYDASFLTLVEIRDALGNSTRAEIDYHIVAPHRITDANDNVAEVRYDPLGVIVVSTVQGQVLDAGGTSQTYGQDRLSAHTPRAGATFAAVLANPDLYLQRAAHFVHYELDTWTTAGSPPRVINLVREEFAHDGTGGSASASRIQVVVSYLDGFQRALQSKARTEPGPALKRDVDGHLVLDPGGFPVEGPATERWLVGGHTVYNRKQQAVRQYEPYYSTTAAYEPEEALAHFGVFQQYQYDAAGRLIRQDLPNGTFSRSEFASWTVRHYDPNDTVLDSLYRTVRDGLADTNVEKKALLKAKAHANTPAILHLDPRGIEVKQVDTARDGNDRVTETAVDLRGQTTAVVDPRGLTAYRYRLDMLGRVLHMHSADAGDVWTLFDIHDRPIHLWDSRDVHQHRRFDALDRPTSIFVDGALGLNQLMEQMIYGDDASVSQAKLRNARGRLVIHRDQAGTLTFRQYDVLGQVLRSERRLRQDYKTEPDWTSPASVVLDPATYVTQNSFNALGDVRRQSLPDGTSRRLDYLQGGGLDRLVLSSSDGLLNNLVVFDGSSFNARGQRSRALLGNGVEITHRFERETFRTSGITARRLPRNVGETPVTLQNIAYTYDPVGNITYSIDNAQQPTNPAPVLQGLGVSPESDFTYDAFYQLTRATGRVHQALLEHDYRPNLPGVVKGTRHITLNNGAAVERYTQTYEYDLSGNIRRIRHQGVTGSWTTDMWISNTSNRSLPALDPLGNPILNPESRFDPTGNCTFLPHLRSLDWSYRGSLARAVLIDRSGSGQPDDAEYYVYDGSGLRVRKVTEKLVAGQMEITEQIYLDGCEIKRIHRGPELRLERTTSHLSDGLNRIALVHRWMRDTLARETDDITKPRVRYQLTSHLGSSQLELDEEGSVISYEEYFPYGGSAFIAGDRVREVEMKEYRFCGKERDDATGFYYFEYRYYAAWIGRWLSPDPIGPEDDHNLYRYCFNNPVNLVDPDGLQATETRRGELLKIDVDYQQFLRLLRHANLTTRQLEQVLEGDLFLVERKGKSPQLVTRKEARHSIEEVRKSGKNVGLFVLDRTQGQDTQGDGSSASAQQPRNPPDATISHEGDIEPIMSADTGTGTGTGGSQQQGGAEHGDNGQGEAQGANGHPAGSQGTSSSGDIGSTGVHDGSSTQATSPAGGTGQGGLGPAAGRAGSGPGSGGPSPGKGAWPGTGSGADQGKGTGGKGARRPNVPGGSAPGQHSSEIPLYSPSDIPVSEGQGTPGSGGVPGGLPGGKPGGTGFTSGGSLIEGEPPGPPALAPPGQTINGNDPNGSGTGNRQGQGTCAGMGNTTGTGRTGSGMGSGTSRSGSHPHATPNGQQGDNLGARPQQPTFGDRIVKHFGYLDLEFGGGDPGGESGGIPGGMGTHRGAGWQALYGTLTIASIVLGGGIKAALTTLRRGLGKAFRSLAAVFTRKFWRRLAGAPRTPIWRQLKRFFVTDVKSYKPIGKAFKERYPLLDRLSRYLTGSPLSMDHRFIKRERFFTKSRGIFRPWLQKLGDAGWNLVPLPNKWNSWLYRHRIIDGIFSVGIASAFIGESIWTGQKIRDLYRILAGVESRPPPRSNVEPGAR